MTTGIMRKDLYAELFEVENNHWWHQHKRLVCHQILNRFIPRAGKLLDIGTGTGKMLSELKQAGWQVFGVDIEKKAQQESAKRGIYIKTADVSKKPLPFPNSTFDLVTALDLLEHIPNDQFCLREMKRVLKPQGIILISVPAYQQLFSYWDKMVGHYRRYSTKSLKQLCAQTKLKIIYLSYYFSFLLLPALMIRIIKKILKLEKTSDFQTNPLPKLLTPFIIILSKIEQSLLRYSRLPFGLSLIGVVKPKL